MANDYPDKLYSSPVLDRLEELGESIPSSKVSCVDCPSGIWYWEGPEALRCYCSAMHRETWNGEKISPILHCDAREQTLVQLANKSGQSEQDDQRP